MYVTRSRPAHRAPWSVTNAARESAARALAPQPGSSAATVIRSIDEAHRTGMVGRHAEDPVVSLVRNLVAFRSLTSDIEVTR